MPLNRARSLQVIDPIATQFARNYKTTTANFIADRVLPKFSVSQLSGQYFIFDEHAFFANDVDNKKADRAPTKEIDFAWSTDTYLAEEYGLKVGWTDLEESQAESGLHFREQKASVLALRMALAKEVRAANLLMTTTDGGQLDSAASATPSVNWDQDTATIEADLKGAQIAMYDAIGIPPNVVVIPWKVAYAMAVQEDIRALLRYDAAGSERNFIQLGSRVLPSVIHGMQVIIPQGAQVTSDSESAAPGSSTVTKTEIWGDDVRCLYVDPQAAWGNPTVGYQIVHTDLTATRWRETDPDINYMRLMERQDEKIVAPKAGYVLKDVLS